MDIRLTSNRQSSAFVPEPSAAFRAESEKLGYKPARRASVEMCTAMCGCAGAQKAGCGFEPACSVCEQKAIRKKAQQKRAYQRRKMRDEIMKDLGLTKVRGAVSGRTYWE